MKDNTIMNTSEYWIDKKVNVSELNLDLLNPRLPEHVKEQNDADLIRNYLLEKEEVLKIARSIAHNGYHRSAVAIVCLESSKMVVLNGNRRLAACQLLIEPKLAPNARDKKQLENLNKIFNKQDLENVKIVIAPSREEADKEIIDIHVNDLSKPWQVLERLRKYKALIDSGEYNITTASSEYGIPPTKFKKELEKLYFHEQILGLLNTEKEEDELLNSGFNKIQRLILGKNGKKLLNYSIDDKGKIIIQDQKKYNENIKKLIPYIVTPETISAQVKQEYLVDNVYSKIDPILFSVKKKVTTKNKTKNSVKGSTAKPDWVTNGEYKSYKGANRVKDILNELTKNKPKNNNINILAVALRVVIELAIYEKLRSKGLIAKIISEKKIISSNLPSNWSPGLKEMLNFMLKEANNIITDPQDRKAINKVMKQRKDFIDGMDFYIHNVSYSPTETKIKEIWKTFGRPIFDIISKLN